MRRWPMVLITLKHRTLNPVAQLFIEHIRGVGKAMAMQLAPQPVSAPVRVVKTKP